MWHREGVGENEEEEETEEEEKEKEEKERRRRKQEEGKEENLVSRGGQKNEKWAKIDKKFQDKQFWIEVTPLMNIY